MRKIVKVCAFCRRTREVQHARYGDGNKVRTNSRMRAQQVRKFCALDSDAENLLRMAMDNLHLSARTLDRKLWR